MIYKKEPEPEKILLYFAWKLKKEIETTYDLDDQKSEEEVEENIKENHRILINRFWPKRISNH